MYKMRQDESIFSLHIVTQLYTFFFRIPAVRKTTTVTKRMMSKKKLFLFSLTPLAFLCIFFVLVEIALRLFAPSLDNPFVVHVAEEGLEWNQINRGYLSKYFPATVTTIPEFKPGMMRRNKTANTFRIFCIGESSMFGTPYAMSATIPAILRKQLRHLYPDRDIEVINLGAAAINSNVILDVTKRLFDLQPDLILLYAGHNEFYGPDGVGAAFVERNLPFAIPLKYGARDLRLVRAVQNLLRSISGNPPAGDRNMMKQVSENTYVRLDAPEADRVFRMLESNLAGIAGLCNSHGVPLIVSDVTSNLLFPPFAYDSTAAGRDRRELIPKMFESGNYESVLSALTPVLLSDSTNAFANYWLGRCYLAAGEIGRGKESLVKAKDNDLLKFRAPERTNAIIRNVCHTFTIPLVSADSLFMSLTPPGFPPGDGLFWEHLHPNARGYYYIAGLFLQKIIQLGIIHPAPRSGPQRESLPFDSDSLSIPWLDHAYADLSIRFLTTRWPFHGYKAKSYVIDSADATLRQIAADVYTHTLGWNEGCYRSAGYFESRGEYRNARTTYESLVEEHPNDYHTLYVLGNLEKENGRLAEAAGRYELSIAVNPRFALPRIDLALLLINAGDYDGAIQHLQTADSLTSAKDIPLVRATIFYGLSAAYANKGDYARAGRLVDEALKIAPSYQAAQMLRDNLAHRP